jgi:hypothetical protein
VYFLSSLIISPHNMALLRAVAGNDRGGNEQELRAVGDAQLPFQQWFHLTSSSSSEGSPSTLFERLLQELSDQGISDYHLRLSNCFNHQRRQALPGWEISVKYGGDTERDGPVMVDRCMSCHLDARLVEGVLGAEAAAAFLSLRVVAAVGDGEDTSEAATASATITGDGALGSDPGGPTSQDSLVMETERMRVWFDAKARPMLVVTPKRVSMYRHAL